MSEVNQHVKAVVDQGLTKIDAIAIRNAELQSSQDFMALQSLCRANWSTILDNLKLVQSENDGKKLVFSALEALDPADYMSATEKLAGQFQNNQLSKSLILFAIRPQMRMQGFFADNYQHPRVQAVLKSLRQALSDDASVKAEIDDLLSGETKSGLDQLRSDYAGTADGNVPVITLPQ